MIARGRIDDRCKIAMNWNGERGSGFALRQVDCAVADMLSPHADHVRTALRGVEQKGEGEPGARSDRVFRLECCDIDFGPSVNPLRAKLDVFYACGRIVVTHADALAI